MERDEKHESVEGGQLEYVAESPCFHVVKNNHITCTSGPESPHLVDGTVISVIRILEVSMSLVAS